MKKSLVSLITFILIMQLSVCGETVSFYDLSEYSWAQSAVYSLAEKGIVKGVSSHSYAPERFVSRADLCTLLHRIFQIGGSGLEAFPDVPADSYYYESAAAFKALGILDDKADGCFHPGDAVTREETMRIAGFLLERFNLAEATDTTVLDGFYDSKLISPENTRYCALLVQNGYITGNGAGQLNPRGYLTRAETAVILNRLYTGLFEK